MLSVRGGPLLLLLCTLFLLDNSSSGTSSSMVLDTVSKSEDSIRKCSFISATSASIKFLYALIVLAQLSIVFRLCAMECNKFDTFLRLAGFSYPPLLLELVAVLRYSSNMTCFRACAAVIRRFGLNASISTRRSESAL